MSTDERGYNGWTNYETWVMALWIDNDEGSYNESRSLARLALENMDEGVPENWSPELKESALRSAFADELKSWQEELMPGTGGVSVVRPTLRRVRGDRLV